MAVAVSDFRVDHPQFANSTTYPDSTISRALTRAGLRMNADVWGDLYDEGQSLLAAHLLALGAIAASFSCRCGDGKEPPTPMISE